MKTTNLFIELLVIGVGAVLCIGLILYVILDHEIYSDLPLNNSLLLVPFTAATYVLGIIFDRIFDILTDKWDKSIRKKSEMKDSYDMVRTVFYNESKVIQDVFDYTKNRIRIIRSWMFYFLIMSIIVLFIPSIESTNKMLISIGLLTLSVLAVITFRKLSYSFYGLLNIAYRNGVKTTKIEDK